MVISVGVLFFGVLLMAFMGCFYSSILLFQSLDVFMIEIDMFNLMNSVGVSYLILVDWLSMAFISVVSLISSVVMLYSVSYMSEDPFKNNFFILVFLFVASMLLMVMSPHIISILLGWDGLGLVSYCLVIYYKNWKSYNAGMITFMTNRVGDLGIILAISWALNFGSFNIFTFQSLFFSQFSFMAFIILLSAMTKSAQIPFSAWLPAAMAAPTPVSSLVHSSTLVTAGVYLLVRFNFLMKMNYYLFVFSSLTMIMSGIGAMFESDMKKIIALSTLSQLGVMMFSLSIGMKDLAFFHLLTHALFKSLLFLCAGFYIHSFMDWQDVRGVAKIYFTFPLISVYFSVASLALSGAPFLAGFYSKDAIIEAFFSSSSNVFIWGVLILATGMTLSYSIRLVFITFFKKTSQVKSSLTGEALLMCSPMSILFYAAVVGGSLLSWLFFPMTFTPLPLVLKLLILVMLSFLFTYFFVASFSAMSSPTKIIYFSSLMWGLPLLSSMKASSLLNRSFILLKAFDQGWLELMGGQGASKLTSNLSGLIDLSHKINLKSLLSLTLVLCVVYLIFLN